MKTTVRPVSLLKDGVTFCRPTTGYEQEIEIDLSNYEQSVVLDSELPANDQDWPKGAPLKSHVVLGKVIYKRKI